MPFVLDASIVHAWAFDESHPIADAIRERLDADQAVAPGLWWFEVRNGLVVNERRGRLTEEEADRFLRALSQAAIVLDPIPENDGVMMLARRHRLSVYDAAYLELALRERLPLATLDGDLATAARREGVAVLGDAA
jgi:predicted nucleic acid-binding protein